MANELTIGNTTETTVFAILTRADGVDAGKRALSTGTAYETNVAARWPLYAIPLTEVSTAVYLGSIPALLQIGVVDVTYYEQQGDDPADDDTLILGTQRFAWTGPFGWVRVANELNVPSTTLDVVYAVIHAAEGIDGGKVWNGTSFVDYVAASWAAYDIPLTEYASGKFGAFLPEHFPRTTPVVVRYYLQDGVGPVLADDTLLGTHRLTWSGGVWRRGGGPYVPGLWGASPVSQPLVTTTSAANDIGGLAVGAVPSEAEVEAIRDACEALLLDVLAIKAACVEAGVFADAP